MNSTRKPPGPPVDSACNLPGPEPSGGERIVDSRDLLGDGDGLVIRHDGRLYRLRRTRQGKLILTA